MIKHAHHNFNLILGKQLLFMNSNDIKQKYKDILYSSSSEENSDDQWQRGYQRVRRNRKIRLPATIAHSHDDSRFSDEYILRLKQQIAQCTTIINRKDQQIRELNQTVARIQENCRLKDREKQELQEVILQQTKSIVDEKASVVNLSQNIQSNKQNIQMQKFDNELLQRQITFYQSEIAQLQKEADKNNLRYIELEKKLDGMKELQTENKRLQADIVRLRELLSETEKYKKFANKIEYKHYIGKTNLQWENWASVNLIEDVKKMLKKTGGTKDLKKLQNLIVKFITKSSNQIVKDETKKIRKQCNSRIKEFERKNEHSIFSMKSRSRSKRQKENKCIRSLTQVSCHSRNLNKLDLLSNKQICSRILGELKQKISRQLEEKQLSRKRISIILDWAIDSVLQTLSQQVERSGEEKSINVSKTLNTTNIF